MKEELTWQLKQGPKTVKELVRLLGRTDSGIRKALPTIEGVVEGTNGDGHKTFALPPESQPAAPEKPKGEEKPTAPKQPTAPAKRGRKASFAGMKLFPLVDSNPRRAQSHGYKSLQIILSHPGVTTETFVKEGGRLNDLRWDVAHKNVRAEA